MVVWLDNISCFWLKKGEKYGWARQEFLLRMRRKRTLSRASIGAGAGRRFKGQTRQGLGGTTYYTCPRVRDPDVRVNDWSASPDWSTCNMPYRGTFMSPGALFCMGANSPSKARDGAGVGPRSGTLDDGRALIGSILAFWAGRGRIGID